MNELKSIVLAADALRRAQEPFIVATVVRVAGSSYRKPGARMLVTRDRWIAGSVSGGCLEGDVIKKGFWRTSDHASSVVRYDGRSQDDVGWGFGLGCDGAVDVLLERYTASGVDPFEFVTACFVAQKRGALATVFHGDGAPIGSRVALHAHGTILSDVPDPAMRDPIVEACREVLSSGTTTVTTCACASGNVDVLVEAVSPPPRLFVLGTGHDAVPLVEIARTVGWEVIVGEPHARFGTRERFTTADAVVSGTWAELAARVDGSDRAMAVVMSHEYDRDRAALGMLIRSSAQYIGVLGPRRRTLRMLEELSLSAEDPRLHAPVGLAIGSETPEEIALAIVAEAQAAFTRATAESPRTQSGSIHVPQSTVAA